MKGDTQSDDQGRYGDDDTNTGAGRTLRIRIIIGISIFIGLFFFIPLLWDSEAGQQLLTFGQYEQPWEVSPVFDPPDENSPVHRHERLTGIEGKVGFLPHDDLIANEPVYMVWYVWGEPEDVVRKPLVAIAVHQETGTKFALDSTQLSTSLYFGGATRAQSASLKPFPLKGLWRINLFVDGDFFESIVVDVKDEYILTDSAKFHVSKDDATVGETDTVLVVEDERSEIMIIVDATAMSDPSNQKQFEFYQRYQRLSHTGNTETEYHGSLNFDQPGNWQIEVLGEKTTIEVKPSGNR